MGEKRRARRSLRIRTLLLAAVLLCAMLPTGVASGMNFTYDLGMVESFDDAETPEPSVEPEEAGDEDLAEFGDVSMGVPEDVPMDDADAEDDASLEDDFNVEDDADMEDDAGAQNDAAQDDDLEEPGDVSMGIPDDVPQDVPLDEADVPDDADVEDEADMQDDVNMQDEADAQQAAAPTPAPTYPAEITITAAGDVTLGGAARNKSDEKFAAVARKYGADYFFSNLRDVFEKDDLTIVNLEGPLTNSTDKKKGQYYAFKGYPAYVQILSGSSVEICNVANNHALDYGMSGLKETARVLQDAGIGVSGFGVSYTTNIRGVRVTSLGFTKWDHSVEAIRRAVTVARRECDILIVSMHWGTEKATKPDEQQRAMGHAAVDAGADLVLGTHSHVYGGIEKYKDKYIVYSLGNFCFGGNPNPSDKRCLVFQQTLSYSPTTGVSDRGINIIPCTVSSSAKTNDYRPTMMGAQAGGALLREVAKASIGMSMSNIIWKPDNYMVWSGIATQEQLDAASAAAMAANNPAPAAAEGAMFQDDADAEAGQEGAEDAGDMEDDAFAGDADGMEDDAFAEDAAGEEDAGDEGDLDAAWAAAEPDEAPAEGDAGTNAESDGDFDIDLSELN